MTERLGQGAALEKALPSATMRSLSFALALSLLAGGSMASRASAQAEATPAPTAGIGEDGCGMTEANASFGDAQIGALVTLQRHRFIRGEGNWREEMNRFLGRAAHVTRLSGVDGQGCPGVRVDVDGAQYFWRVRDLGVGIARQGNAATVAARAAQSAFLQTCRQAEGHEDFGTARVGTAVVLQRHRAIEGDDNWSAEMEPFVGRTARIVGVAGLDGVGCPGVRVDVDGGQWFWRVRDLHAAGGSSFGTLTLASSRGVSTDHGRPEMASGTGDGLFGSAGGSPGPQACGLTDQTMQWEGLAVGTEVTIGRHRPVNGDGNWDAQMDPFVARTAHVTELIGVDDTGCGLVHIDIDGGQWFWRARDLTITGR